MKYNIQEELEKFKLLTKYDSSKTLSENIEVIEEQVAGIGLAQPGMSGGFSLSSPQNTTSSAAQSGKVTKTTTQSPVSFTDITGAGIPELLTQKNSPENVNNDRIKMIQSVFCKLKKQPNGTVLDTEIVTIPGTMIKNWADFKAVQKVTDAEIVEVQKLCPKPKVVIPIPPELNNVAGVQAFQDWLDGNVTNWATDYPGGKVSKSPKLGYGMFGRRTQSQWNKPEIKETYLKFLRSGGVQNSAYLQGKMTAQPVSTQIVNQNNNQLRT